MESHIFRKKSIQRVTSPEQLNDYIRVCNPSLWVILIAVILLLCGAVIWGIFGRLDTKLNTVAVTENGTTTVYIKAEDINSVLEKKIIINETEYTVSEELCSKEPIAVNDKFSDYVMHLGGLMQGEWVYTVTLPAHFSDGVYVAQIITESVAPMIFVMN